jgi:hypothetical protein
MTKAIPGDIGATANHFCQCDVYSDKIVVTVYTPTLKKIDEFTIPFTNKTVGLQHNLDSLGFG